jgi:hypothetical protein
VIELGGSFGHAYGENHSNKVLKCHMFVEGIPESRRIVLRYCTNERADTPPVQICDKSVMLSVEKYQLAQKMFY